MTQNLCNYALLGAMCQQSSQAFASHATFGGMVNTFRNNFHLLRLLLAVLVMLSHGNYLFKTGYEHALFHSAEWAVNGFFVISGLLISWSIERQFNWRAYSIKRFVRIYPLYAVVIAIQMVVLIYFSTMPVPFKDIGHYMVANLSTLNFMKPTLGDMVDFPFNGSLWTIKIEVMFYIALPFYLWFVKRLGLPFVLASWLAAFVYRYMMEDISIQLARQLPGAMTFFISGYVLHRYGQAILIWLKAACWRLLALCALLAIADLLLPGEYAEQLVMLCVLMAGIYAIAFYLPPLTLRYDISYGIYLMHFPLFVTMLHLEVFASAPALAFIVGCAAVVMLAFLATLLVEEPMIRWGKQKAKRYETDCTKL